MAKTRRELILISVVFSAVATALGLVTLSTTQWISSDAEVSINGTISNEDLSSINYGLFSGSYIQVYGGTIHYQIKMTCLYSKNVCALLCGTDSAETRLANLERLYNGETVDFTCSQSRSSVSRQTRTVSTTRQDASRTYINAGLYLSTLIFLCISIFFGVVSTILSIWNVIDNPVQDLFNIFGLYIYNGIACGASLMVLILWGSLFGVTLAKNVCFHYSILGLIDTDGMASLGYSYWLMLPSMLSYAISMAVLLVRRYLIEIEPDIKVHTTSGQGISDIIIY